jgi:hypothetical protein
MDSKEENNNIRLLKIYISGIPETHLITTSFPPYPQATLPRSTTMADYTDNDVAYHNNTTREDLEQPRARGKSSQQARDTKQKVSKKMVDETGISAQQKREQNKQESAEMAKAEKEEAR